MNLKTFDFIFNVLNINNVFFVHKNGSMKTAFLFVVKLHPATGGFPTL